MVKYLIDTNICIYHFNEFPDVVQFMIMTFRENHNELMISVITEAELLSSPILQEKPQLKSKIFDYLSASHYIIDINRRIASLAGEIRSFLKHDLNMKIHLPDALIAATAIYYDATLVSNNDKDFLNIVSKYKLSYYNPIIDQNSLRKFLANEI